MREAVYYGAQPNEPQFRTTDLNMPLTPLTNLLENTNGRQRRFVLLGLLGTGVLILLLISTALSYGNGDDTEALVISSSRAIAGTQGTGKNQLTVAVHDPLYERFDTPGTPVALNLAIAREFASRKNLQVSIVKTESREDALQKLRERSVDLVFSNHIEPSIYPMPGLKSVTLEEVQLLLIGMQGPSPAPRGMADLQLKTVAISDESGTAEVMQNYVDRWPDIELIETKHRSTPELLDMVMSTQVQYTVVQSNEFLLLQHFFPELISRYELSGAFPVGWLVSAHDPLYVTEIEQFVRDLRASGRMQALAAANNGHLWDFNYSEAQLFLERVSELLPAYRNDFQDAADAFDLDTHLLAAIAHQESHWDPLATSPTGVRGMMMLTQGTAEEMQVSDRLDAAQSIMGGARYYRRQYDLLPDETPMPDRLWIALASYNLGRVHVLRAQERARHAGNDPLEWQQLRQHLLDPGDPATSNETSRHWISPDAKVGPVSADRSREAVKYVDNVRRYYDMLAWIGRQSESFE